MKKISIFLICTILLSACSMTVNEFLGITPTPTVPPPPTQTNIPTDTPIFTPTVPTPTFTLTPTLVGQKTKTSTPEFTPTELILSPVPLTVLPSQTPVIFLLQTPIPGFLKILVSDAEFYKRKECLPLSVKFTVQVDKPSNVAFVVLFVRFKSKVSGVTSKWTSIPMQSVGVGTYEYVLSASDMKAVDSFENAWVEYQIVSTDANIMQVGKTDIFSERLALLNCVPSPTPVASMTASVTPNVTDTALTP
jgi:hypothetical protein